MTLVMSVTTGRSVQAGGVLFVDDDAPAAGDGLSWSTAYRFLQDALADAAGSGGAEIRIAQGTYFPDQSEANPGGTNDTTTSFSVPNGVDLLGSFAGPIHHTRARYDYCHSDW